MYGWIQETIEALVLEKFGREAWQKVKLEAGLASFPTGGFARNEYYNDAITMKLVSGLCNVCKLDMESALICFGEFFISWLMDHGYASMLRNQGSNMFEFLTTVDDLHQGLQKGLPELVPPRMICTKSSDATLSLEYISRRSGLAPMVIGIVRQVGRQLFQSDYSCTMEAQKQSQGENGEALEHSFFKVTCISGRALDQALDQASDLQEEADSFDVDSAYSLKSSARDIENYDFLQQNPTMAGAFSYILVERVKLLDCPLKSQHFGHNFEFPQLMSLMASYNPEAAVALSGLFRQPLSDPTKCTPVPRHACVSGPGGRDGLFTKSYDTIVMNPSVFSGNDPLLLLTAGKGYRQVPVELSVCVIPDPLRNGQMLKSLANTPNDDVLATMAAQALLDAAWGLTRSRKIFDITCESIILLFTCGWIFFRVHRGLWPCLVFGLMKEFLEKGIQTVRYWKKGWSVPLGLVAGTALNLTLYVLLVYQAMISDGYPSDRMGQMAIAVFGCTRWWSLLAHLRGFKAIGSKILPILYALGSMGPFLLVFGIIMLGFLSSFCALSDEALTMTRVRGIYFLAMLGEEGDSVLDGEREEWWLDSWVFLFVVVMCLVLLNILIGILGEAYDMYRDSTEVIFSRERARVTLSVTMRLLPMAWPEHCANMLQWLFLSVFTENTNGRHKKYLWVVVPQDHSLDVARITSMKEHVSRESDRAVKAVKDTHQRLEQLERDWKSWKHSAVKCPFSGAPLAP
ncbi:gcy-35 [Symbiodinium sp. CCMP2592]|nr:gcy-35 [Symbiodinium sp. CCMP2592]